MTDLMEPKDLEEEPSVRVLISVDMEGVAGVVDPQDVRPGESEYERNRELMTDEANAAIAGVVAHAADAEILVSDAHAQFRNLLPTRLDPCAKLLRGKPREHGMVAGLEAGVDSVVFVGYHGKAGTPTSVLSHTMSGASVADIRLNGDSVGEIGLNAALAAHLSVVPVCVVGDDTVAAEAESVIPGVRTVVVKRALGVTAAENLHPQEACRQITDGVSKGLRTRDEIRPKKYSGEIALEVDVFKPSMTESAMLVPGMSRIGGTTLRYVATDMAEAYRIMRLIVTLA